MHILRLFTGLKRLSLPLPLFNYPIGVFHSKLYVLQVIMQLGTKTTTSGPLSVNGSKRAKIASTSIPPSGAQSNWAQAAQGDPPPPPHSINKYELRFSKSKHIAKYDSVATRRIIEPKYMDIEFLTSVGLWDSFRELIKVHKLEWLFAHYFPGL